MGDSMQQWHFGKTVVTRIEEMVGPMFDPVRFFPDFDPAIIEKHRGWLFPAHMEESSGNIVASMHSWLIQTEHHNILVDTCIGNDKERMPYRNWHQMNTPWLTQLIQAGVTPDDIDFVMCTHLHVDHVGWNTRLSDGNWVPTFPNAKYLFSKTEYEFWEAERHAKNEETFNAVNQQTFDDSVVPIMHLAELVEGDYEVLADLLRIEQAPGHTPGSITLTLRSGSDSAIFTGDICHHPIQVYEPHWNSAYCEIPDQAIATRRRVLTFCSDTGASLMPAHFGPSYAGHVRSNDNSFLFDFS